MPITFSAPVVAQAQTPQPQAPKGNFLSHILPTIGGIAGGGFGGAAGGALIGTGILPGVGTAVGGLLGALLGGAAGGAGGKVVENKLEGQALGNGVAGSAIENGVFSAGPLRLLKAGRAGVGALRAGTGAARAGADVAAPGLADALTTATAAPLKTSLAGKADAFGNKMLSKSIFPGVIDKPMSRATDPAGTTQKLLSMGLNKSTDVERTAQAVTGSDGLLNKAVAGAVAKAGPLDVAHLPGVIDASTAESGLVASQAKALNAQIRATTNLIDPSNPESALKAMRALKTKQQEYLGKGNTYHMANSEDKLRAEVINKVHSNIEDTLYNKAGANANISSVLTPELNQQLLALHPGNAQWAQHVKDNIMSAKSVGDLRSAQAPFVNASRIFENTAANQFSVGGQVVNNTNSLKGMAVDAATNLVKQPVQRVVGNAAKSAAPLLSGGANGLLSALSAPTTKQIVRNGVLGNAITGMASPDTASAMGMNGQATDPTSQINSSNINDYGTQNSPAPQQPANNSIFAPENAQANIQKILAGGGKMKDVVQYISLVDSLQKLSPTQAKPLTGTQAQQANNAQSGLDSLATLKQQLQKDPSIQKKAGLPGGSLTQSLTGTGTYKAAINNATDVIGRLRSGGAIGAEEQKNFIRLLPQTFDDSQTVSYKLNQLNTLFQRFANPNPAIPDVSQMGLQ